MNARLVVGSKDEISNIASKNENHEEAGIELRGGLRGNVHASSASADVFASVELA